MISVQNRLPEPGKENRVSITPDNGSAVEGVLAYADDATQEGTFWNRKTAQLLQGDIRTYPVREGQSISAGDVVNVGGSPETVYRDVVPQDNVENVISSAPTSGTAVIKINDEYSVGAFITTNNANRLFVIDNADGTRKSQTDYFYSGSITSVSLAKISDNKFVVLYISSATLYGIVCTVNGTTITIGSQYTIASSVSKNAKVIAVIALSDSLALSIYNSSGLKCKLLPISGTTITTSGTVYSLSGNTGANHISACRLPDEGGNKSVCICFADTRDGNKGKAVIATIDSNNAVTFGDIVLFRDTAAGSSGVARDNNQLVLKFGNLVYVSNFDLSSHSPLDNIEIYDMVQNLTDGKFIAIEAARAFVFTVSDGVAEVYDEYQYNATGTSWRSSCVINSDEILIAYASSIKDNSGIVTHLEIDGTQIAGSFTDNGKDAIALASGNGGDIIPVGFGGYCECPGVTEGETITSDGVNAFSPLGGWLKIFSIAEQSMYPKFFSGLYTGNGGTMTIDVGKKPYILFCHQTGGNYNTIISSVVGETINFRGMYLDTPPTVTFTDTGVKISKEFSNKSYKYKYIILA